MLDLAEKLLSHLESAYLQQHVRLGPNQFIGFGVIGSSAVSNDLSRYPGSQGVGRDSRKRVRPATLQSHLECRQRLPGSLELVHLREPLPNRFAARLQFPFNISFLCVELMDQAGSRVCVVVQGNAAASG